jgi:hypothetical protein
MQQASARWAVSFTLAPVELEIRPEPEHDDRAAIEAAVEAADIGRHAPAAYASPWRQAALRDVVGEHDPDP